MGQIYINGALSIDNEERYAKGKIAYEYQIFERVGIQYPRSLCVCPYVLHTYVAHTRYEYTACNKDGVLRDRYKLRTIFSVTVPSNCFSRASKREDSKVTGKTR